MGFLSNTVADLGGKRALILWTYFFHLVFGENWPNNRLVSEKS